MFRRAWLLLGLAVATFRFAACTAGVADEASTTIDAASAAGPAQVDHAGSAVNPMKLHCHILSAAHVRPIGILAQLLWTLADLNRWPRQCE